MAVYKDLQDFQQKFTMECIKTRTDYLEKIKYATIAKPDPFPWHWSLTGLLFAQKANLVKRDVFP